MKSVAVIGTALMDTLLVSPSVVHEETCNKVRYFEADGGSMRNVAHNCSLLGIPTVFWAKFGNDILALQMIQRLEEAGCIVHSTLVDAETPHFIQTFDSTHKKTMFSSITDEFYFDSDDAVPTILFDQCDYGLTDQDDPNFLKLLLRKAPRIHWIAVGFIPDSSVMSHFDGVVMNRHEALVHLGNCSFDRYSQLLQEKGFKWGCITLDQSGVLVIDKKSSILKEAHALQSGTDLGCGDAFVSALLLGLIEGNSVIEAAEYGLEAASHTSNVSSSVNPELKSLLTHQK